MTLFVPLQNWPFETLVPHHYNLMAADPPWLYEAYSERGHAKGASSQYQCWEVERICEMLPMGDLADPNTLFLCWGTAPLLDRQIACVKAWGFEFKSLLYWRKVFRSGATAMGCGYRVRSMAEPVIVATRGEPKHKALPGLFAGVRREHSRKPDEFYEIVNRQCSGLTRRVDLFARQSRPGWVSFGNEATKFDEASA